MRKLGCKRRKKSDVGKLKEGRKRLRRELGKRQSGRHEHTVRMRMRTSEDNIDIEFNHVLGRVRRDVGLRGSWTTSNGVSRPVVGDLCRLPENTGVLKLLLHKVSHIAVGNIESEIWSVNERGTGGGGMIMGGETCLAGRKDAGTEVLHSMHF